MLKDAPSAKSALENFKSYADEHNYKKRMWDAPIPAGYNSVGYDHPILDRYMLELGMSSFFHPIIKLDIMLMMWPFFENDPDIKSLSADNLIRGHMGYSKGTGHDALSDVIMTAELLCKTMHLHRRVASKTKFKGCFNV
jgi:DNA polymerase III epsilon subunit-like protein